MPQVRIIASLTRHYGAVSMTFGLERDVDTPNAAGAMVEYNKSLDALEMQFADFEAHRLPKLPVPSSKGIESDTKNEPARWYPAKVLRIANNNGKAYFSIIPEGLPSVQKYGAGVYWDTFKGMTESEAYELIDVKTMEHKFPEGMMVLIEKKGGKHKAQNLAHKDTIGEG